MIRFDSVIVALLTTEPLVVHLKVLPAAAVLAAPTVTLEYLSS